MPIDVEHLRQHYASLSDEEFDKLDRNDLTAVAQKCYDNELARRSLRRSNEEISETARDRKTPPDEPVEFPDEEPFVACAFREDGGLDSAQSASEASAALQASGIPARIELREVEEEIPSRPQWNEYQVVVPNGLSLEAASILDRDFFNIRIESDWKTHLESLSDEQLLRLNADTICEGFLDRAARLKKAYNQEVRRRKL